MNDKNDGPIEKFKKCKRQMKTPHQLAVLEKAYASEKYPCEATKAKLSENCGLTDRQLQMWFCHRRLKDKEKEPCIVKRARSERLVGERMELLNSSRQKSMSFDCDGGSDHGSRSRSSHGSRSRSESGSGSGSESDSTQSNEPLEAAHILGQIASLACSRQSRPQTLNFTEIQSRIEKEVTTRVASHVDSLRFEMEERMQAMNAKQERMQAEMNAKEERMQAEMRKMRQMLEDFLRT